MSCPDDELFARFLDDALSTTAHDALRQHTRACRHCRALLVESVRVAFPEAAETKHAGRYELRDPIGMGGMGIVYRAFDPDLSRYIAVKLLRPSQAGRDLGKLRARFIREAKSVAQVVHPNVVAVYDVGEAGDRIFIAMELVEGGTLRNWMASERRTIDETLTLFVAIGHGLGAMHAAGLVHRDFKPENVLIGADGRPRVSDFGLAMSDVDRSESDAASDANGERVSATLPLTRTGALIGTPTYMAPEQLRGEVADRRSDVFAFCVSLYEALVGVRPFSGSSVTALEESIVAQRLTSPSTRPSRAVERVLRIVQRGLAAHPDDRFATIEELLRALESQRTPKRSPLRALAIGTTLVLTAAAIATPFVRRAEERNRCAQNPYTAIWDAAKQQALTAVHDDVELAKQIASYTSALATTRTQVCEATYVRHDQSELKLEAQAGCLDRLAYGANLAIKSLINEPKFATPMAVFAALPEAQSCVGERPRATPRTPAETVAHTALRQRLSEARNASMFGRSDEAADAYNKAAEEAIKAHEPQLLAWSLLGNAQTLFDTSRFDAAAMATDRGVVAAFGAEAYGLALTGIAMQIQIEAAKQRGLEQIERYAALGRWTIGRGPMPPTQIGQFHRVLGDAYLAANRVLEAEIEIRAGRAIETDPEELAAYDESVASVLVRRGDVANAVPLLLATRAAYVAAIDESGPQVARIDLSLAQLDRMAGKPDAAVARLIAAVGRRPDRDAPNSTETLELLLQITDLCTELERNDEAYSFGERALRGATNGFAADDPMRWEAAVRFGAVLNRRGEYARTRTLLTPLVPRFDKPSEAPRIVQPLFHAELAAALLANDATASDRAEAKRQVSLARVVMKNVAADALGRAALERRIDRLGRAR